MDRIYPWASDDSREYMRNGLRRDARTFDAVVSILDIL
jgi:hypothetical protein